jgi:hypothetical protein
MAKLLLSASAVALLIGLGMPVAKAQYYGDDEGYRRPRHYDDDYRPSRRHYDDDEYYTRRPRRPVYEDDDYHRHAPVIIIHPPSWMGGNERPSYGSSERPSGGTWSEGGPARRPTTTGGGTDSRPAWEKENRPPTKEEWNGPGGGYGGKN